MDIYRIHLQKWIHFTNFVPFSLQESPFLDFLFFFFFFFVFFFCVCVCVCVCVFVFFFTPNTSVKVTI